MCVRILVDLAGIRFYGTALCAEPFEVSDPFKLCRRRTFDDIRAAVGCACQRRRHITARLAAELAGCAAVAPKVATCLQRARIQTG